VRIEGVLRRLAADLADPADDAAAPAAARGRIRARQIAAIARLTPAIMAANALNALAVVLVFHLSGEPVALAAGWAAAAIGAAGWFWAAWRRKSRRPFPEAVGPRTTAKAVRNAAILGALWAFPSVALTPGAALPAQAFLLLIAAGMVSGGVTCFYPIPRAAAAYSAPIVAGAVFGLAQAEPTLLAGGLIVTASYLLVVRRVIARHSEIFVSEIVARIELEEKTRRVEALMARTEAEARRVVRDSAHRLERAQKMEAVGQLAGGMAHDFNNILSVIRGNAELQLEAPEKDAGLVAEIVGATERGAALIQKLLAFSRRQSLRPEPVDAARATEEAASVLRRLLSERITVTTRAEPGLTAVRVDRAQLDAALFNLALNARDAMPEGGPLEIASRSRVIGEAEAAALAAEVGHDVAPGRYVAILVRDHGAGMDAETAARAFEPFFSTKPIGAGTGLGLSMVLGFIRQSGGFVTIDTAPGLGATVTMCLPAAEAPAAAAEPPPPPRDAPRGAGERVLLVEDQADVRGAIAAMLRGLGYEVAEAGGAAEAAARLSDGFDARLVLSDIVLPGGGSGYDLARRLKRLRPELPVLLMSGYPETAGDGNGDGDSDGPPPTLTKPFSRRDLARAVRVALDRGAAAEG
jgi:signal transduction histidine kinase/CheY-like chemotaxis protein